MYLIPKAGETRIVIHCSNCYADIQTTVCLGVVGRAGSNGKEREMSHDEKQFHVSFVVSCKNMKCSRKGPGCSKCIEAIVAEHIYKYADFRSSQITTPNGSRQFGVSFLVTCKKPDCSTGLPPHMACCTGNSEKCEMCLRSIIHRGIILMSGFHAKEIAVV